MVIKPAYQRFIFFSIDANSNHWLTPFKGVAWGIIPFQNKTIQTRDHLITHDGCTITHLQTGPCNHDDKYHQNSKFKTLSHHFKFNQHMSYIMIIHDIKHIKCQIEPYLYPGYKPGQKSAIHRSASNSKHIRYATRPIDRLYITRTSFDHIYDTNGCGGCDHNLDSIHYNVAD